MKIFIWFMGAVLIGVIQASLKWAGIVLGGLPTFILCTAYVVSARKLCKLWDEKHPQSKSKEKDVQTHTSQQPKEGIMPSVKESEIYIKKQAVDEYISAISAKLTIYRILTAIFCLIIVTFLLVIFSLYSSHEQIERLNKTADFYVAQNVELKNENKELSETNETISRQLDSYHYCTALLNSTKDKYYHIIGCKNLNDEFYVYGNTNAKNKGYKPCPDCLGE